jgi:alpha/beta superfamily hydrolase
MLEAMTTRTIERVAFEGPAGRIAGLLHVPGVPARAAAVVSHPHPLHGGTKDNKVAYRVARALEDGGASVLRFDFRGAGGSEGVHDGGVGEQDDLRAAIAFLRLRANGAADLPLLLAGFSFGSAVSARVGIADGGVAGLLLVGAPLRSTPFDELSRCSGPVAFVHGERDEHGPVDELRALVESLPCPHELRVVAGASHFFDDRQEELYAAVRSILDGGLFGPAFAREGAR